MYFATYYTDFIGAYFVGKLAWPKGLDELYRLLSYVKKRFETSFININTSNKRIKNRTGKNVPMDIYGQGPHQDDIKETAKAMKLPVSIQIYFLFTHK